jgi:hypothetical protein
MRKRKIFLITGVLLSILIGILLISSHFIKPSPCDSIQKASQIKYSFDSLPDEALWNFEVYRPQNVEFVSDPVYEGNASLRFTVKPGEKVNGGSRAELVLINSDPICSEAWYRWRFLVPENYLDKSSARWQLMGQWHDQPDWRKGETWKTYPGHSPMVGLYYGTIANQSGIALHYGINKVNNYTGYVLISKGVWNEVLIHVLWSQSNEGFIEAWINNQSLTPFNGENYRFYGPNMYNQAPAYLKLGLYRDPYITTENSFYYDDFQRSPTAFYEL